MADVVKDLLKIKNRGVLTIEPGASVYDAIAKMADKQIGALVVTEGNKVVGIITERDYARKVILQGKSSKSTSVREIMTGRVIYVQPNQKIEECMVLMTEKRIRHLPVLDGDMLVGMISIGDVVRAVISEKEFLIDQLTRYISGY
ncbi:MAG: CBS domain-containing protein [Deltaproteobacteria bacterium]|nr:CBS domain-containing protein [Deltaproteobacteria bacterium]